MWFEVLKLILSVADAVTSYMERKQLLDAGKAQALRDTYAQTITKIRNAQRARDDLNHDADGLRDDSNNRD